MNRSMVFNTLGRIMRWGAIFLLLPCLVALIYGEESCLWSFLLSSAISLILGVLLGAIKPKSNAIYAKEGFAIVAMVWLLMSLVGALPFYISREIPDFADAFFETVSGFTTTGATILTNVEDMSHALLFWRSFSHWIGGMGVLVFVMALIPNLSDRSIHIMRAEMAGPSVGKLVPRAKDTAKILCLIYVVLTTVEVVFLLAGKMPLFDSLLHAFGTAGTGGFGIKADSIAGYSPYLQWVIAIFMLIFGINFNLFYLMVLRRFRSALRSTELWVYIGIVAVSVITIALNIRSICFSGAESIRLSVFQVASIITTTGYATADFNLWPELSRAIIFLLMFIGGCAGSTAGGIKVSRVVIMIKMVFNELRYMVRPRSVNTLRFEGKPLDDQAQRSVANYFLIYILCYMAIFVAVCYEPFGFETNFTAVAACFNNIGPGFGAVGPAGSFAEYSWISKIVLSFAMLLGRLEIFPLIIALSPQTWTRK